MSIWNKFCKKCKSTPMTSENVNGVKSIICKNCNEEHIVGLWSKSQYCIDCCDNLNICPECGKKKNE